MAILMSMPLHLLLVENSINEAERLTSAIKSAGYPVRPTHIESEERLRQILREGGFDLALIGLDGPVTLDRLVAEIHSAGRNLPVIAMYDDESCDVVECMKKGAYDAVFRDNIEHLKLIVHRAVEFQHQYQRLHDIEVALRESERRCKTLLDSSRDAIAYVHDGMHLYANDSYRKLIGHASDQDVEGTPIMDVVAREDQEKLKEFLRGYSRNPAAGAMLTVRLNQGDGEVAAVEMEFSPAMVDGEPCTQVLIRDREQAHELERQLTYLSQRDLITGLYNRRHFITQLEAVIDTATLGKGNSGLIEITIDNFDEIRNQLGVAGSDVVLGSIGKTIEAASSVDDIVAHLESESFVILTRRWETPDLDAWIHKLVAEIAAHIYEVDGRMVTCTASGAGVAILENSPDADEMISRVHSTCARAAASGSGNVLIYKPKPGEMSQKQLDGYWCKRINRALMEGRFNLLYQAIVSLHGNPKPRYDIYLRMADQEISDGVSPHEFLPSAERGGMAVALDRWVITHAFKQLVKSLERDPETVFFIHLSAGVFSDPQFLPWLVEQIKSHQIPAECIIFKMKEDTVISHLRQAKDFLKVLRSLDCGVALDDFGSGLNPFQLMQHIAVDYFKIDTVFMEKLADSKENQESLRRITETARESGQQVIAPNIEDAASLSVLWNIGVNFAQGNFMQSPTEVPDYDFTSL